MEHSSEYKSFIKWLHSSVQEKMDGYRPDLFDRIYEWERVELEDIIWELFNRESFSELACYLPQLTRYDGISALKNKLAECTIPGSGSRIIAKALYNSTGDDSYLEVFRKNYETAKESLYIIVTELSYCRPGQKMFEMLCDFYLNGDEKLAVDCAAWGIFFCVSGVNPNTLSIIEQVTYCSAIDPLVKCDKAERTEQLTKFLLNYPDYNRLLHQADPKSTLRN